MGYFRNVLLVGLLVVEIAIFGFVYLFGNHGINQLKIVQEENQSLLNEVNELKSEVKGLEKQFDEWKSDDFYKEKIARERLQMSRPNEHIYHLT